MKKTVSIIIILTIIFSLSVNSIAKSDSETIYKIKDSYIINADGTISTKNGTIDKYSKAINYLIAIGAIEVNSNGEIIDNYDEKTYYSNLKSNLATNKKIDYDALYQECINPSGKYYGIVPVEELNNIINHIDNNIPKEKSSEIRPQMLEFDYYNEALRNTVLLSYTFYSYIDLGLNQGLAWFNSGLFFVDKVRSGGDWDYKSFMGKNTPYYCYMKNYYGVYTGESIGNMHYGTVGSYLFKPSVLKSAAGLYQIYSNTAKLSWFKSYFDDPNDQRDIQLGIDLHSRWGFPSVNYLN